jgi:hypothetical protein
VAQHLTLDPNEVGYGKQQGLDFYDRRLGHPLPGCSLRVLYPGAARRAMRVDPMIALRYE